MVENYRFRYDTLIAMLFFNIVAIYAIWFQFSWTLLVFALIMEMLSNGLGLAVGYHRLLTHRGFHTPKWVEYVITWLGMHSLQGKHIPWVAIHRKHHENTDKDGDPHTPRHGFWWSHLLWMLWTDKSFRTKEFAERYAPDLLKDKVHVIFNQIWWIPSVITTIVLFLIGGLPLVLWGIFVPVAVGLNFTWAVNSVCHLLGSRPNKTGDDSTNNWLVALLTWGEGWHNNHHAKPTRARHGMKWYQIDVAWMMICVLSFLRLATNIKL